MYERLMLEVLDELAEMTPGEMRERLSEVGITSEEALRGISALADTIRKSGDPLGPSPT